jgi:modulator of FtsH protease HflC
MRRVKLLAFLASAVAIWALASSAYTVQQSETALVIRLGKPLDRRDEPGIYFKIPLVDSLIYFEKRLISLEPPSEEVILGDQKRIEAGTYTRFRISDPLAFYQAVGTIEQGQMRLSEIISSVVRRELGEVKLIDLLTQKRESVIEAIRTQVILESKPLGIDVADVRILRADLPKETSEAIYDRMKSERQREAKELRAQGFEWAQDIQAKADKERTVILAEAQQRAKIIRGDADATASSLMGEAHDSDRAFYTYERSLQTYGQTLSAAAPVLLLSSSPDFLKTLENGPPADPAKTPLMAQSPAPAPTPSK